MERGKGLKFKTRYKYCKQPNGMFTIFDVPIFSTFTRVVKGKSGGPFTVKVTPRELQEAVNRFEELREERGYYPAIHEMHQELDSPNERRHIGYIDNLSLRGQDIYCDLCEIDEKDIERIKNLKLGYRSAEYDPSEKAIESLALLSTKPPHFHYPLLALEDEAITNDREYILLTSQKRVLQFQKRSETLNFNLSQEERKKMYEEEKDKMVEDSEKEQLCGKPPKMQMQDEFLDQEVTEETMQEDVEQDKGINEKLDKLIPMMEKIAQNLNKLMGFLEAENEQMGDEKDDIEDESMGSEAPSSVAMGGNKKMLIQFNKKLDRLQAENNFLIKEIVQMKNKKSIDQFSKRLYALCEERGLDYNSNREIMLQFSSDKDKSLYLKSLDSHTMQFQSEVPGMILEGFSSVASNNSDYMKDFQGQGREVMQFAKEKRAEYRENVNQFNHIESERFRKIHGSEKDYVTSEVELMKDLRGL